MELNPAVWNESTVWSLMIRRFPPRGTACTGVELSMDLAVRSFLVGCRLDGLTPRGYPETESIRIIPAAPRIRSRTCDKESRAMESCVPCAALLSTVRSGSTSMVLSGAGGGAGAAKEYRNRYILSSSTSTVSIISSRTLSRTSTANCRVSADL